MQKILHFLCFFPSLIIKSLSLKANVYVGIYRRERFFSFSSFPLNDLSFQSHINNNEEEKEIK